MPAVAPVLSPEVEAHRGFFGRLKWLVFGFAHLYLLGLGLRTAAWALAAWSAKR